MLLLKNTNRIVLRFLASLFVGIFLMCGGIGAAHAACGANEIDVLGDGTQCETAKFTLTTTNTTNRFSFSLSVKGTFYVDWGDGIVETIVRDNTTATTYTHKYSSLGAYTIGFSGGATNTKTSYNTGTKIAAISFYQSSNNSATKIASISGNLSSMFPMTSNAASGAQPRFYETFRGATNLTSLPNTLFADYTSGSTYMFFETFWSCSGLTSIPENLFFPNATSVTGQNYMFAWTFQNCTSLTSIPGNLFSKITTSAQYLFNGTFYQCSGLTSLPQNLFFPNATSVTGAANYMFSETFSGCTGLTSLPQNLFFPNATSVTVANYMFNKTFKNCTGLTSLPADLFSKITTSAQYMFYQTFQNCSGLTSLPENLFFPNATSVEGAGYMFLETFNGCTGLTSLPADLFSEITTSAQYMFSSTFSGCTGLTSLPENLFFPNATSVEGADYMFRYTFSGCTGLTSLPGNLFSKITTSANYMFSNTFYNCKGLTSIPENLFFPNATSVEGADYMFNGTFSGCSGLTSLPANLFSKITTSAQYMFSSTFSGCSNLGGYIPPTMFKGLIDAEHPTASSMFNNTFNNTQLMTSCPTGTTQFPTGYEGTSTSGSELGGKVSCEQSSSLAITLDDTGADAPAVPSTVYLMYNDGWYSDSGATTPITGLTTLPTKSGYTFFGYYTEQNGGGTRVIDNLGKIVVAPKYQTYTTLYPFFVQTSELESQGNKFSITTTNTTNVFKFRLNAQGTFYVDWGDGDVQKIVHTDAVNSVVYTHNYSSTGAYTIKFGGTATGYSTSEGASAIRFSDLDAGYSVENLSPEKIASISGNLSSIFPWLSGNSATGAAPRFYNTFAYAKNLTSIPNTLFADYTRGSTNMFKTTFSYCSGLTSIPENLFFPNATSVTGQNGMFQGTFTGCSGLTSLPANLFSKVTTSAQYMFRDTFYKCRGLTSIPENLFFPNATSVTGQNDLFYSTFSGCSGLTSLPANLFSKVTTSASEMFAYTFSNCRGLTSIPENLFFPNATSVTGQIYMFLSTFSVCTGLTSLPADLFSKITTSARWMFQYTFYDCSGLTSLPNNLFFPNATSVTGQSYMFNHTFYGCSGLTSIPTNLFSKITTSESAMFQGTFTGCSGLTSIPENLFFPNATSVPGQQSMFGSTFSSCSGLTSIPANLFSKVTTSATNMFQSTFFNCSGLTSIPENLFFPNATSVTGQKTMFSGTFGGCYDLRSIPANLFSKVTTSAESMFESTFSRCEGLTSIPDYLFSKITTGAKSMFSSTFSGCKGLSGSYILPSTFHSGLTGSSLWNGTFTNTNLLTSCPDETSEFDTGYKGTYSSSSNKWGDFVSCQPSGPMAITLDTTGATTSGSPATVYLTYNTGWTSDAAGNNTITTLTTAPTKTGKVFGGFYTGQNGTGTQVVDQNGVLLTSPYVLTFTSKPTTVYAYFRDGGNVTYNCGTGATGGTPPAQEVAFSGVSFTPAANTCTKEGYMFVGWGVSGTEDVVSAPFTWNYSGDKTLTAQWVQEKFSLTTTNTTNSFYFSLSAKGTFYVDWGDGTVETIVRDDTTNTTYTHNYSSAGAYTIKFGGSATNTTTSYSTDTYTAAISFEWYASNIASISGNLSSMFPMTSDTASGAQPRFYSTFFGATNLTSLPSTLFADYTSGSSNMFNSTFSDCDGLTSLPENLFFPNASSVTGQQGMFTETFNSCDGLTSLPANLFSKITTSAENMFNNTFSGCGGLTSIPENLFFPNASSVTGQQGMFNFTFSDCDGLTSLPANLFSKITTSAESMFAYTFSGCSNISGYIPPTMFKGLIDAGHPTATNMFYYTFNYTGLATSCPTGTTQFFTGYEGETATTDFGGKVSCVPPMAITLNTTGADTTVNPTTVYLKYNTGWASDSAGDNTITTLTTLPTKTGYAFNGFWTGANGTGTQVIDKNGVFLTSPAVLTFTLTAATVYADFVPYTVTYECGSDATGTPPVATTVVGGEQFTPAANTCVKDGHAFAGWAVSGTNDVVSAAFTWNYSGDKTLTATWMCSANEIDVQGDGRTQCETAKFTLTTTDTTTSFKFSLSAKGTFYVDCGDGGTLSGGTASGKTIDRSNTLSNTIYTCTYSDAGAHTIKFGGSATDTTTSYNTSSTTIAAISFYAGANDTAKADNASKIASISGNLSAMFPYISNLAASGKQPRFYRTFSNATNLTSLPSTLFADYTSASAYMFYKTFNGCTSLNSIQSGLFSGITTGASSMFDSTFSGCTSLDSIPSGLFSGITTGETHMFDSTFSGCTSLDSIPSGLFSSITTGASYMFDSTFSGCTGLENSYIRVNTFRNGLTGNYIWQNTFQDTNLLTECPTPDTIEVPTDYKGTYNYANNKWGDYVTCASTTPIAITLDTTNADTASDPTTAYLVYYTKWTSDSAGNNTITRLTTLPTKSGKAFGGFYTGQNGSGTPVVDNEGVFLDSALRFTTEAETVYAYFGDGSNVTYNCGTGATGGTPPAQEVAAFGGMFTPATNTCIKEGYMLAGWAVSGTDDVVGAPITWNYSGDKTLTAQWVEPKFSLTTTNTTNSFSFSLSANGTFYVDWGDGDVQKIVRNTTDTTYNTTNTTYTHNYSRTGAYTIRFGGSATNTTTSYSANTQIAAISFYAGENNTAKSANSAKIASISGNLSSMFPMTSGAQPRFYSTFYGAKNLTSLPSTLFADYTSGSSSMFENTFAYCSGLTSLPENLFFPNASSVAGQYQMFDNTFQYCSGLTSIPANLFSKITTSAQEMFFQTFAYCSGLTSLPNNLFFPNATSVTGAYGMFQGTFFLCSGLTSIPGDLFFPKATSVKGALFMFKYTFYGCSGLTSLPANLFSKVKTSATGMLEMFYATFSGCTNLTGYIPPTTFKGLIDAGSPTDTDMFKDTFNNTQLEDTECPTGTSEFETGYKNVWGGYLSCVPTTPIEITLDTTGATAGTPTSAYLTYDTKWTSDSAGNNTLTTLTTLPTKSGYVFAGFYTGQNGTGTQVVDQNGVFLTSPAALTFTVTPNTIYAYFADGSNVTYACGSGTTGNPPAQGRVISGAQFTPATNTCTKDGYMFAGWAVSGTNDVVSAPFTWNYSGDKTLTAQWVQEKFSLTTTNTTDSFSFSLTAAGTFYVDWGDGTGETIERPGTKEEIYKHNYSSAGAYTIKFGGSATNTKDSYSTDTYTAAISFSDSASKIASISGNLSSMFPMTSDTASGAQPRFSFTFNSATNLTSLPSTLFADYTSGSTHMFFYTFGYCRGLTSIPENLFFPNATSVNGASYMFFYTFEGCSGLTSLPANLFSKITTSAEGMFYETFAHCSGLTSIPENLFFPNATSVTGQDSMFSGTFWGCNGLTSLPANLFSKITTSAEGMFSMTFSDCSNMSGYIPATTFKGLINAGSPTDKNMFYDTFFNTKLEDKECPTGTSEFETGYKKEWDGYLSCVPPMAITLDTTGATTSGSPATVYLTYNKGWTSDAVGNNTITTLTTAPTKTGKFFGGFYTGQNGTGTQVVDPNGVFLTSPAALTFTVTPNTIYAYFTDDGSNVTYACGADTTGNPPAQGVAISGAQFTPATNTCTKDGYMFVGWAVSGTNDVVSAPFTWKYSGDKTLTAQWGEGPKFTLTTTNTTDSFSFRLSAKGTFYVDWGDGTVETIERTDTKEETYTHNYSSAGAYTIKFGGSATNTKDSYDGKSAAISFNVKSSTSKIASISGNLSSMFPYITANAASGVQPRFNDTFAGATNLTSLPSTLFADYTSGSTYMFDNTFAYCSGLTSIPENLFFPNATSVTGQQSMFAYTFNGCSSLTSLPANLFSKITTSAESMFYSTFQDCSNMSGYIPATTFNGLINAGSPTGKGMFDGIFKGTQLEDKECPTGTSEFETGYKKEWDGYLSCVPTTPMAITLDTTGATTSGSPATVYLTYNTGWTSDAAGNNTITTLTTAPTKTGKFFGGFYTGQNGTGTQVVDQNGVFLTSPAALKFTVTPNTIYAYFADGSNVTYACGSGTTGNPPAQGIAISGVQFTPATNTCTKDGYMFAGWAVSGTEDVVSAPFTWNYSGDKTLTAQWVEPKFSLTTTNTTNSFNFSLTAKGTFYVDWGDGTGETIERTDTKEETYTHKYSSAGAYTIKFGGSATNTKDSYDGKSAAISFNVNDSTSKIASISGNLSSMFPMTSESADGAQPRFNYTFSNATNLTSLPSTLFADYTSGSTYMFSETFNGCSGLTSIPENLFFPNASSVTGQQGMFYDTFSKCYGLTSLPANLFSKITTSAQYMFAYTFNSCDGLTSLPANLFSKITTSAQYMFDSTFSNCSGLTSIPENLFFPNATSVTGQQGMFAYTFSKCYGLTSLPANLFSKITTSAGSMFAYTFYNCTNMSGYIPATTFNGLINAGSPTDKDMFYNTFNNTSLTMMCPARMAQYITGYENEWNGRVSCISAFPMAITLDTTGATTSGSPATVYLTYNTKWTSDAAGNNTITTLTTAPTQTGKVFGGFYTGQNGTGTQVVDQNGVFLTSPATLTFTVTPNTIYAYFTDGSNVTYACGSDTTGNPPAQGIAIPGMQFTPATNTCIKAGYIFTGWAVSGTNDIKPADKSFEWNYSGDKTLTAQWVNTNVTYNCGTGATGTPPAQELAVLGEIFIPATNTCIKAGYIFTGWAVSGTNDIKPADKSFEWNYSGDKTLTAQWVEEKFSLTTTNTTDSFGFSLTAKGTFYVDWGDGTVETIVRDNTTDTTYTHNYSSAGAYTIKFGGSATNTTTSYGTGIYTAAISFNVNSSTSKIASVSGNLSSMFPMTSGAQPRFYYTFSGATNLTSLPSTLFADYTSGSTFMFYYTFSGCSGLTSIPENLFFPNASSVTGQQSMFYSTFSGCSGLTSIPANLFSKITTSAQSMFSNTFSSCRGLTSIPANLFSRITTSAGWMFFSTFAYCSGLTSIPENLFFPNATSVTGQYDMFGSTFSGCSGLTSIPANLFSKITTSAQSMFNSTFSGCGGLTSIPENLFFPNATSVTGQNDLFYSTFSGCSGLTSLPANLFSKITTSAERMFFSTFAYCSGLTSIPENLFFPNATSVTGQYQMFSSTFSSCSGLTSIPANLFSKITTSAQSMFSNTFSSCRGLTSIPENLFFPNASSVTSANNMFQSTFSWCSGLTSLPANLFSRITTSAENMFNSTFNGCTNMSGYIPPTTFNGLINAGSPTDKNMFYNTFYNTKLEDKECPTGTSEFKTEYEKEWGGYLSCQQLSVLEVALNNSGADTPAAPSTAYLVYNDGWYSDSGATTAIKRLTTLPTKSGYVFMGYYTSQNGSGTRIIDNTGKFITTYQTASTIYPYFVQSSELSEKFSLTTTNTTNSFSFRLTAAGTFYVDWGDGTIETIVRDNTTDTTYTHNYSSAGAYTIKFGGSATNTTTSYSTDTYTAAISFNVNDSTSKIASVSGNLSSLFPMTSDTASGAQPRFYYTFYGATNLTSLPSTLFADYTSGSTYMFYETFEGCSGLTSLPENLFFPNASSVTGQQGMFFYTFARCSSLTSLPANLFSKITTSAQYMFTTTFSGCSGLTSIPENLFFPNATSVTGADYLFSSTFESCTGLTSLPANLFSKVTTSAEYMFSGTFYGCSGLTSLPENLFFPNVTSVTGQSYMFNHTFYGCRGLTSLPADLFSKITTSAQEMFSGTFSNCSGLTSLPNNLFFPNATSVTGANNMFNSTFESCTGLTSLPQNLFFPNATSVTGANYMFRYTFSGCRGLTSLPANLFSKITTSAQSLFYNTFVDCDNLTGYIPSTMFKGLIDKGSPKSSYMFYRTFNNTKLATSCPIGTTQYITGYEGASTDSYYFGGKVSCIKSCGRGYYLPMGSDTCAICPENSYCAGGEYDPDDTIDQGIVSCASGLFAPTGMWEVAQCGRKLHIGDVILYLRTGKKTPLALNFDINSDETPDLFGNLTTADVPMTEGTDRRLKVNYNNTTYSVYDDTIVLE